MDIHLQPGERKIDTWSLFYIPPNAFDHGAMNIDKVGAAIESREEAQ